jgi:hypothetical protein
VPKTPRSSWQISPSVTPPSTQATIRGMRLSVPRAASISSPRSVPTRRASRRARSSRSRLF